MIIVSEAVARAGLLREESRGAHTRLDFEGERSDWSEVNIVTRKGADGRMEIRKEARGDAPGGLAATARSTLEELDGGIHVWAYLPHLAR